MRDGSPRGTEEGGSKNKEWFKSNAEPPEIDGLFYNNSLWAVLYWPVLWTFPARGVAYTTQQRVFTDSAQSVSSAKVIKCGG